MQHCSRQIEGHSAYGPASPFSATPNSKHSLTVVHAGPVPWKCRETVQEWKREHATLGQTWQRLFDRKFSAGYNEESMRILDDGTNKGGGHG